MSTSANTSLETHEIEKGIYLHIKAMNQQTADGDPVTLHVFSVNYASNILLRLKPRYSLNLISLLILLVQKI